MNYYERHIGDYLKDTAHLSLLEHGVYTRLLDVYYTREGSIPDDQAERLVAARTKEERAAVHAVLAEFFERHEDGWHQDRCDREIERFNDGEPDREVKKANTDNRLARHREERRALFQKLTAAGKHADWNINMAALRALVSALPATGTETGAQPLPATAPATPATATHTQSPIPEAKEKTPPTPKGEGRFPEFWNLWPRSPRKGGRPEALKVWQARNLDREADLILAHVRSLAPTEGWTKQGGEFVPAPVVYLRGRRWDGADTPETRAAATQTDWRSTRDGVQGRAYQLGFGPYAEIDDKGHGVSWASYRQQVITADQAAKAPA